MKRKEHNSIWHEFKQKPSFPKLEGNITVDVTVVGGGITGLTTALMLKRSGISVALITDGEVGDGASGYTSGHLTCVPDIPLKDLVSKFGFGKAQSAVLAWSEALEQISELVSFYKIDCDFERVSGYKFTENSDDTANLEEETSIAESLGLQVSMVKNIPIGFPIVSAFRIKDQAQFHPLKYLYRLAELFALKTSEAQNTYVFEHSHVLYVEDGSPSMVITRNGRITSHIIVLATHTPIGVHLALQTRLGPYDTYVLGAKLRGSLPSGLFWDMASPYHYIRSYTGDGNSLLILGGADHKNGQEENVPSRYMQLEEYLRKRYEVDEICYFWSYEIFEPADGLPYIGRVPFNEHLYTATGFAGQGLTSGTLSALILADKICGRKNSWEYLFRPARIKPLASLKNLASENANVVMHYFADRMVVDSNQIEDIPVGEGALVNISGEQVCVYRHNETSFCALKPHCTHMRGIVHWNSADKTWDCPLHGGRYRATGEVINGPPTLQLQPVDINLEDVDLEEQEAEFKFVSTVNQ